MEVSSQSTWQSPTPSWLPTNPSAGEGTEAPVRLTVVYAFLKPSPAPALPSRTIWPPLHHKRKRDVDRFVPQCP